jgi:hypothetical protein
VGNGIALWKGDTWDVGWGTLTLDEDGALTLRTVEGEPRTVLSLDNSAFIDAYATDQCIFAVGAADEQVIRASRNGPNIDVILIAERLQKTTVGAHAVRFHPLPGSDGCLLTWELGAAMVSPETGFVWSHLHSDPDLRLLKIAGGFAELAGLHRALTIDLSDGTTTSRELERHLEVDIDTLAEWRRGIGR